jgi:predicted DNA-binding transcriptional regulator YafY
MGRKPSPSNAQTRLIRQCQILIQLSRSKSGLTADELKDALGVSRSTFFRELDVLRSAGAPIELDEKRYRFLNASQLPALGLSALQIASLHLVRLQLAPLGGSLLLHELDRFLDALEPLAKRSGQQTQFIFAASRKPPPASKVVRAIERALHSRLRACIEYRAASRAGASTRVHIEPLVVSVAEADPYVRAFCVERNAERTYKLSRIQSVEVMKERATHRPVRAVGDPSNGAVKAWSGPRYDVKVRLDASVAWLAREYPLPDQVERPSPDGSVTIEATVAGLIEVRSRILAWGAAAEVLEPEELRKSIRDELAEALRKYDGPGPVKASPKKSKAAARSSLNQVGARVG